MPFSCVLTLLPALPESTAATLCSGVSNGGLMLAEFGLTGWLLVALAWLAAGLGVAWMFGRFAQVGSGERASREIPSAVRLYTNRNEEHSSATGPVGSPINGPAKL